MNEAVVRLLERPSVYLAWQRPFVASKLGPVWRHTDRSTIRRVLDVGCGPGTNSAEFAGLDYLGVDLNPSYIEHARRKHRGRFEVADVRSDAIPGRGTYDFVLVNSLLHHLDDEETHRTLSSLPQLVTADGMVHILDLVLPDELSAARALAKLDRGRYPRRVDDWRSIFASHFHEQIFEPYTYAGLWAMVYFRGSVKT